MDPHSKDFSDVCRAVAAGDPGAAVQFREMAVPYLRIIIRHALRTRPDAPPRGRMGSAHRRFSGANRPLSSRRDDDLVDQFVQRTCASMIEKLRSACRPLPSETIFDRIGWQTWG
ncbi:MAG: hypothetical protein ACYTG0_05510 [Planctomycetota bacterium]